MKIEINTKEDSHEEIRKVIKMLQHIIGDPQEVLTNEPSVAQETSPIANIFGDTSTLTQESNAPSETTQETQPEETSESTEDLFAELFSEEELKKMDVTNVKDEDAKEDEEEEVKPKGKKYNIEFF